MESQSPTGPDNYVATEFVPKELENTYYQRSGAENTELIGFGVRYFQGHVRNGKVASQSVFTPLVWWFRHPFATTPITTISRHPGIGLSPWPQPFADNISRLLEKCRTWIESQPHT
jgi:hypothetical protein